MAQTPCLRRACGETIDYTPVGAKTAGDVVVLGTRLVGIVPRDIDAGVLGSLDLEGLWEVPKVTGTITQGSALYWDDDADPLGGDAGSGAFTTNSALGPFAGFAATTSSGNTIMLALESRDASTTTLRSALGQDDSSRYNLPLASFEATGTGAQLGATAGTPSGAMGLTIGTFGTNTPLLVGEAANNNSKTDKARIQFALPPEYVDGQAITVRVRAKITGNVQVAQTVDVECYVSDGGGGVGSDICATAAQSVTTSFANKDFTITPTSRVRGEMLDIQLTALANDTGGSANKLIQIGAVEVLLSIKG